MLRTTQMQRVFYDGLMESEYWPQEKLRELQQTNLVRLLRHANAEVPFYSDRLAPVTTPSGDIDLGRWDELPIVKRRDMVDSRDAMQARRLPNGHGPVGTTQTSGSTGLFIEITTTALQALVDNAARLRGLGRCGIDWTKNICSRQELDPNKATWPDGLLLGRSAPPWLAGEPGHVWGLYRSTPAEETFEFLKRNHCAYLIAGAKTAHALAIEARRLGVSVHLDAILGQGQSCDEHDRAACRSVFGAEVVQHYSSKEMGQACHPCELGTLHINEENLLLEIVDELGQPCAVGVPGRVVITPFYSTAQPLVRYEQGDIAIFGPPCACGRPSRTIETIVGRIAAIFRHPDGRAVSRLLPERARTHLRCEMFQIAQTGPTQFEVRFVPLSPNEDADEAAFSQIFREEYFEDAELRFIRLNALIPSASGKITEYLNEYYRLT